MNLFTLVSTEVKATTGTAENKHSRERLRVKSVKCRQIAQNDASAFRD
jgi:hypothetical protein